MINLKSLEMATRKANFTYTNEGPYHSYTAYVLWQNPARTAVSCTVVGNVLTAEVNPVLGKRVTLTGLGVVGEKYIIPLTGDDFQLAETLEDAKNAVSITVADGTGTVRDADITAEDTFEVLQSYQVGPSGQVAFLNEPQSYTLDDKAYINCYFAPISGPVANISHILYQFSPNAGNEFEVYAFPSDVYGLAEATTTSIPSGQTLRITAKPYLRVQIDA